MRALNRQKASGQAGPGRAAPVPAKGQAAVKSGAQARKAAPAPGGVRNVALLGPDRTVTLVTARGSAAGHLDDFKALARKVGARGRTALIAPMIRTTEVFEGTESDLQAALKVQRSKAQGVLLGAVLAPNHDRRHMLRASPDGLLTYELATIRSAGLPVTHLTGLIEAAARYNTQPQLIFHLSALTNTVTMAVNTPTYVDVVPAKVPTDVRALDHMLEMTGVVITEQGLTGDLTILLLGDFAGSKDEVQDLLAGERSLNVHTVSLSSEDAARQLITAHAVAPGSLGGLTIPLDTPSGLRDYVPHIALGVPLAVTAGIMFALATGARAETQRLNAQTAALEVQAQEAAALKASNDALEANIAQARKLATDRGTLAADLRDIALMLARNGARVDSISGPGAGSSNSADYDGRTVRATYTLQAMVTSPSAAEALILDASSGHYASNVQSVACDSEGAYPCTVDLQLGLTNPSPTPQETP